MASAYLTRTKTTPTNAKIFTASVWVKKTGNDTSNGHYIIDSQGGTSGAESTIAFEASQKLRFGEYSGGNIFNTVCDALFRDVHGWYHIVVAGDSTQGTASNRVKIWVNGELQSVSNSYPSQDHEFRLCKGSSVHDIGRWQSGTSRYFDGQMAHFHFVDGTAYTPTTFGETDSTTGIWKPKTSPSGVSYGNNGFWLKFDNSANMGLDSAGSNNFTTNGTVIQTKDTPTNVFAAGNSLIKGTNGSSNINNTSTSGQNSWESLFGTLGVTAGKYYAEFKTGATGTQAGVIDIEQAQTYDIYGGSQSRGWGYDSDGIIYNNGSNTGGTYASFTAGDVIGIALDMDNHKVYFHKNGTYQNSGNPTSGATGTGAKSITSGYTYTFFFGAYNGNMSANFGNGYFGTAAVASAQNPDDGIGIFEYDVPAGYRALCTTSLNATEYS
tara:strand:+ start:378 stop:1691 length:1314 start_codon:yes stop_codon:yes gene_type:complete